jgi:endonuclease/exonuclease/phosphatase family metal-dependent hydrolase
VTSDGPTLRLVTWNVHAAVGLDGRRSVDRIADALRALNPDVACLQELDVHRPRSGDVNQPAAIALRLGMDHLFGAALNEKRADPTPREASYGNAIFSRLPLLDPEVAPLPGLRFAERRAVVLATIESPIGRLRIAATHLGLVPHDRWRQADALLEHHRRSTEPTWILAGDLNELPGRGALRRLEQRFERAPSPPTFPAIFPLLALDHVLFDRKLAVRSMERVSRADVANGSDHLPVVVTLGIA